MAGSNVARTCPTCGTYLAGARACPRCANLSTQSSPRAYAATLRRQATTVQPAASVASSSGRVLWGPITGQVRREQETMMRRAGGTGVATLLGVGAPILVALVTGATSASSVAGGGLSLLMILLMPLAILVLLLSLGGGGPLAFMGRFTRSSLEVSAGAAGLAALHRSRRGAPGRILIIGDGQTESRVAVARPLDIPIGSTVTVHGPRYGGYRHAWFVRVHGLDHRALPTRGVIGATVALTIGSVLAVLGLIRGLLS